MPNRVEYIERSGVEYRRTHTDAHSAVDQVVDDEMRLTSEYRDAHGPKAAVEAPKVQAVKAPAVKAKAVKSKARKAKR